MAPHIPDELLLQIFSHLLKWESRPSDGSDAFGQVDKLGQGTLASLSTCCKRFRAIAQPILYSVFVKPENIYDRHDPGLADLLFIPTTHKPNESLRSFLRTLLVRPDLAALVKTVQLRPWETENTLTDESQMWPDAAMQVNARPMPPSIDMARQYYGAAMSVLPEGDARTDWLIALCRGDEDAEVALLLALLPNVETLQLIFPNSGMDEYSFYYFHSIVKHAMKALDGPQAHMFSRLKVLEARSFWVEECEIGLPIYPFSDFFRLPCLETFIGHHMVIEDDPEEWGEWSCPPAVSKVQNIHIRDSVISSSAIAVLVKSCTSLRTIDVAFHSVDNVSLEFSWPEVGEALKAHSASLQSLSVDIFHEFNLTRDENLANPPLGDLRSFALLQDVQLQQSAFIGLTTPGGDNEYVKTFAFTNMLPPSLRSLSILRATSEIDTHLEALARDLRRFPHLRRIQIQSDDESNPRHPKTPEEVKRDERINRIGALFEADGVGWKNDIWLVKDDDSNE